MPDPQPIPHLLNAQHALEISPEDVDHFYLKRLNLPLLSLPSPLKTPLATGKGSITRPATTTVKAVRHNHHGLKQLWIARDCWARLFAYVSYEAFERNKSLNPPPIHVSDCPGAPIHPPEFYSKAVTLVHSVQLTNKLRRRPTLTTNESARDAVNTYIYDPVNAFLQMRYHNTTAGFPLDAEDSANLQAYDEPEEDVNDLPPLDEDDQDLPKLIEDDQDVPDHIEDDQDVPEHIEDPAASTDGVLTFCDTKGNAVSSTDASQDVFYPCYGRVLLIHHRERKKNTSGYTDKLLFRHPGFVDVKNLKYSQCVVSEAKTPWSYPTSSFYKILNGWDTVLNDKDVFQKGVLHEGQAENALLKQLWGQCHSLGPDIGFTTNLDVVMVVIRVKPKVRKAIPVIPDDDDVKDAPRAETTRAGKTRAASKKVAFAPEASKKVNLAPEALKGKKPTATAAAQNDEDLESGFILSPLMKWTDHRLLPCLVGLSYLALDEGDWVKTGRFQTLRDILCPGDERVRIRHAQT